MTLYHSLRAIRDLNSIKNDGRELRIKILNILFSPGSHNPYSMTHALNSSLICLIKRTVEVGKQKHYLDICIESLKRMSSNLDQAENEEKEDE